MVEEEKVVTEPTTGSPEGIVEQPSAQPEGTPEASEAPSGQPKIMADGIPEDDHRLPLSRVEKIRQQYEDRIAALESQLEDRGSGFEREERPDTTIPATAQEHPLLTDLKRMYPNESDRLAAETFAKPFIDHIAKLEGRIAQTEGRAGELFNMSLEERGKAVFQRFPDLKKASKDDQYKMGRLSSVFEELGHEDPYKDAYDVVFKDKVATKQAQDAAEKQKHLMQLKKNAVTVGGPTGSPTEGKPPIPMREGKEANAYIDDGIRRAFRST